MTGKCKIGNKWIGGGETLFLAANIGVNHNGEVALARRLVEAAAYAGCDAVVLQKCVPERHIPPTLLDQVFATPWGDISYLEYRHRMELGPAEFRLLSGICRELKICWAVSVRDIPSVDAVADLRPDYYRVPAAAMADAALLAHLRCQEIPVMLCARRNTDPQVVRQAIDALGRQNLVLMQGDSDRSAMGAPFPFPALNPGADLAYPVGVAGAGRHFATTLAAIAMGACVLERPVTLHRTLWGGNQAASIEPWELQRLTRQVRSLETDLKLIRQKEQGNRWVQQTLQMCGGMPPQPGQTASDVASEGRMRVGWKRSPSFRLSVHFKQPGCSQIPLSAQAVNPTCACSRFPGLPEKWRKNRNPAPDGTSNQTSSAPKETCDNESE